MTRARATVALAVAAALAGASVASAQPAADWRAAGGVVASPDGANVYAAGDAVLSFSVDGATGALALIDAGQPGGSSRPHLAISPDGRFLYSAFGDAGSTSGIIILSRDPATGLLTHEATFRGGPEARVALAPIVSVTMSPDGGQLYVVQRTDDALHVFNRDRETGMLSIQSSLYTGPGEALPDNGALGGFALSPDGRFGYLTGNNVTTLVRDPGTGALSPAGTASGLSNSASIAVAPDGRRVYAGFTDYNVFDRDPSTGRLTFLRSAGFDGSRSCASCGAGMAIGVSPNSRAVFSPTAGNGTLLQAAATADGVALERTYTEGADGFTGIANAVSFAWSPDGRILFVSAAEYIAAGSSIYYNSTSGDRGVVSSYRFENGRLAPVSTAGPGVQIPARSGRAIRRRPGISINDGATYTNDPNVTVRATPPPGIVGSLRLANAPAAFGPRAIRVDPTDHYPWVLAETGGARDVRHVYVRFTPGQYDVPVRDLSDDIILDQRPPQLLDAALTGGTLTLRARDNRSGVRRLQVTQRRAKPGAARRFARRVRVARGARVVHVRVIDGAGNRSRWRTVRAR